MPSISPETVRPKLGNTKKTLDDCNGMKNNMPIILPGTVSPKLGNTKKTFDDCNGMKNNVPTFLPGTVSPKLGNTKKTLDDCNVSENLDVASYIQSKFTKSHSNLVVEPTGFNQDEIRAKKVLEPRHGDNLPEKQKLNRTLVAEDVDNSLTNPVRAEKSNVIEKTKGGRNIRDVDNSLTNPVVGDVPHGKEETNDGRNRNDGCFVILIEVIYVLLNILSYQKTLFGKCTKSCKGVHKNKGIASAVICFSLMIGFGGGVSSSNAVCSVSSHLEGIPSESLEVGKGMKLICRHNCSKGTPRWDQDKPIGRDLTFNRHVQTPNTQNIELEIIENEYNIIFLNATFADINSTYTCHYGFNSTQINPIEYYKVLPTDKSISKQSVYKNNVLNGILKFKEVYPLPECFSYCDDKRRKEISICKTCKIWKRNFYKVKFIFNIDFNNNICREENVSVRCAVGKHYYAYDFSKWQKTKKYNKETTGIWIGVIIGVIVLVVLSVLGILYKRGTFRRCRRGRNVENQANYNETEHSPNFDNDSQNITIECIGLLHDSNRQTTHDQHEMHSDGLKTSKSFAKNANTKPGVKHESTCVQPVNNAVNRCEEWNGTGQMCQSPDVVHIPVHCDIRKSADQSTMAIGSELNATKSKKDNSFKNTNVKASEQMSTSDVLNFPEKASFSGGINPNSNAEEE